MAFLSAEEKQKISAAIRNVESGTQGELLCVITSASNDYRYLPLFWSVLVTLLVPAVIWMLGVWWNAWEIYFAQIAVFLVAMTVFQWSPVKMRLIPKHVQTMHAARRAREQFYAQCLHRTRERTGVLLFVSVAEHFVEILADEGIHTKVAPGTWDNIVAAFVDNVRQRRTAQGFLQAIEACGTILQEHFPARVDNPDELPNRLIEV